MKIAKIILVSLLLFYIPSGQGRTNENPLSVYRYGISAGMGLSSISMTDVVNYVNSFVGQREDRLSEFNNAIEFFGYFEYAFSDNLRGGVEYAYLINSHNVAGPYGRIDFKYSLHQTTLLVLYTHFTTEYHLKFGGGLTYIYPVFQQKLPAHVEFEKFTGNGFGGKLTAIGHTPFGDNLYGYIGLDFRFASIGNVTNEYPINMDYISFGIKFGLTYYL